MREHAVRSAVAGVFQHGRPEQGVEIEDVLADEVVQLGAGIVFPPGVEVQVLFRREFFETGHVADRCVQPDVKIFARRVRDFKAEVGCVARNVPVLQSGGKPFVQLVGSLLLKCAGACPFAQERFTGAELEEVMLGFAPYRRAAGHSRHRVDQVGGRISRAAYLAAVAILILRAAFGALALDEAVRQEHFPDWIVVLLDGFLLDQPGIAQLQVHGAGQLAVFLGIGRVVTVETDVKAGEIAQVLAVHARDQLFRRDAFLFRAQHDGRAVGVVGTDVITFVSMHFLEAHPDIGLDVFHQVTEVDGAIGVGQGGGDENFAGHGSRLFIGTGEGFRIAAIREIYFSPMVR